VVENVNPKCYSQVLAEIQNGVLERMISHFLWGDRKIIFLKNKGLSLKGDVEHTGFHGPSLILCGLGGLWIKNHEGERER
jgi:hypothetical protein